MAKMKRLPILAVALLCVVFVFGTMAGAFMYATGNEVLDSVFMKMVSHTEYRYGEGGQIIARLVNFQGDPVVVDSCNATILYPDKTHFVNALAMSPSTIPGDHYINFTTPDGPEGVYEYQATCYYTVGATQRNQSVTNSFHLSSAFTSIFDNLSQVQSDIVALDLSLADVNASLFDQISAVNASLAADIDALASQLNTNVSTILDAIAGIDIAVNFTEVLTAIEGNASVTQSLIDSLDKQIIFTDYGASENSTVNWLNVSNSGTGTNYYTDVYGFSGGDGGIAYSLAVNSSYATLIDADYVALSDEEKVSDITYEFALYIPEPTVVYNLIYFIIGDYNGDWGGVEMVISDRIGVSNDWYDYINVQLNEWSNNQQINATQINHAEWNLFQLYYHDYDETTSTHSVSLYVNDVLVAVVSGVPVVSDPAFTIGHEASVVYMDNIIIYQGSPQSRGIKQQQIYESLLTTQSLLATLSSDMNSNFTYTNARLQEINVTVTDVQSTVDAMSLVLNTVDTTTTNTYNYVTGSLTTAVDNILYDLGVINATVNRIETISVDINETVSQILANQEDEVRMTVFSG